MGVIYKKSDFKKLSWKVYGEVLEKLYKKVSQYTKRHKLKISGVIPILRGGAFPGAFLAYKLHSLKIIPVQYKYIYYKNKFQLRRLLPIRRPQFHVPPKPIFLLVENNHCFGTTAISVAKDLRKMFPGCRILYAAALMDYSYRYNSIFDVSFFGQLSNETRGLSKKEAQKKHISNNLNLYPWENIEEELAMVSSKSFRYI